MTGEQTDRVRGPNNTTIIAHYYYLSSVNYKIMLSGLDGVG
jgi:hypothetical protein